MNTKKLKGLWKLKLKNGNENESICQGSEKCSEWNKCY